MSAEEMFRNLNYKELEKQNNYDKEYESTKNEIGDTFKICFNSKNKTIDLFVWDCAIRLSSQDIIAIYKQMQELNIN